MQLTPSRGSGVNGTATLTDGVKVELMANADGTGSATTTVKDVKLGRLFGDGQHRFILVHAKVKKGQGVPPGSSCADLPQQSTGANFETLPSSGGLPPVVLLAGAWVLQVVSISAVLELLRFST